MNEELVTFAEDVRIRANVIASKCLGGRMDAAGELACELAQLAADVQTHAHMRQEQAHGDAYDLNTLAVNLNTLAPE